MNNKTKLILQIVHLFSKSNPQPRSLQFGWLGLYLMTRQCTGQTRMLVSSQKCFYPLHVSCSYLLFIFFLLPRLDIKGYVRTFSHLPKSHTPHVEVLKDHILYYSVDDPRKGQILSGIIFLLTSFYLVIYISFIGTCTTNAFGAFDFKITIPEDVNLGTVKLSILNILLCCTN